jgi:phytoene desaturase
MSKKLVIIGAGQGGLSAAIHAALEGWRVTVLEAREVVGGKAAQLYKSGFKLDPGPSIIILTDLYEEVFTRAGKKMEDYLRFKRLDPFARIYFEGSDPVDLPANREDCLDLLTQKFPEDGAAMRALLEKLDKLYPYVQKSVFQKPFTSFAGLGNPNLMRYGLGFSPFVNYRRTVDGMIRSPELRAFFYGFPSYGGQSYESRAPGAFLLPYLMIDRGVYYPEGGVGSIPKAFYKLAEELGVEFRLGAKVIGYETSKDHMTFVQLESGEEIRADAFISNIDPYTFGRMEESPGKQPSYSYFTLHFGLKKQLDGLSHHTLLIPQNYLQGFDDLYTQRRFPDPPIVYLNATNLIDPEAAPEGCTNLFCVVTSPANEDHLDWETLENEARERTITELRKFGFSWQPEDVVFERVQTPITFERRDGNFKGSLYGPDEKSRFYGMFPLVNKHPQLKNLTYCGGAVQPGAGLPMVTLSGRFAVQLLG